MFEVYLHNYDHTDTTTNRGEFEIFDKSDSDRLVRSRRGGT